MFWKKPCILCWEWRVDFPVSEGMDEQMMDLYRHADAYVQCVAKHMCPHCMWECHSNEGDNWLWSDCILNGGNVVTLSRILGHSNLSITQNYINLLVTDLAKQVEEINLLDIRESVNGFLITSQVIAWHLN